MRTERFDPAIDTEAVRACHDIHLAEWRADGVRRAPMSPRMFQAWLRYGWTEDPPEAWLARDDAGEVCGWYLLTMPERENRHQASVTLVVAPARRRAGLGTALLRHAADRARQNGRTLLTGHSHEDSAGAAFARSLGATHRLTGVYWALRPRFLPAGHLAALREKAAPAEAGCWTLPRCSTSRRMPRAPRGRIRWSGTPPGSGPPTSGSPRRGGGSTRWPPAPTGPGGWWRSPSSGWIRSTARPSRS